MSEFPTCHSTRCYGGKDSGNFGKILQPRCRYFRWLSDKIAAGTQFRIWATQRLKEYNTPQKLDELISIRKD